MTEIFAAVLDMSMTASVVIGVVLLLRLLLSDAPKVYSYALWSVVLFRLLCPVSIESGWSILPDRVGYEPTEQEVARYEAVAAGEEYLAAYHAVGDALNGGLDFIDVKVKEEYESDREVGFGNGYTALDHTQVWMLLLSRLWPIGMILMAGNSLLSLNKLRKRLRHAVLLRDNIYQAEGIETAFVLGLFRPKIYLPAGLSAQEQPYIIRHEQLHIRSFDHIIKILAFAALCIHWFNPLVWLAFVLAGKDMEMSCDEAVMKEMGEGIRADYSQSLLCLATGRRFIAGTPLAFGEGDTKGRIKNVLKWKKPKVWVSVLAMLICVIGICACAADPVQSEGAAEEPEQQEDVTAYRRGLAFEELKPGAAVYLNEDIVLAAEDSSVDYHITYSRMGLTIQVGLRYEDGTEYVQSIGGGANTASFDGLPAGRYTPFVRNVDEGYRNEPNATGVVNFDLTSDGDYFQKSTPWPQEEVLTEPVHLSAYEVLHEAILDHHRSSQSDQYFCCESHVILANEDAEQSHPVTEKLVKTMTYYLWVLYQEYDFTSGAIVDKGGAHIPTIITLAEREDGTYELLYYREPRDGSYYVEDIKKFFPGASVDDALDSQKFIYSQVQDCYAQAVEYAKTDSDANLDTDEIISDLLDVICSSPLESSNPQDYIDEHAVEYRELLYYGKYTREYCVRHLEALEEAKSRPFEVDLRGRIMERLVEDLSA